MNQADMDAGVDYAIRQGKTAVEKVTCTNPVSASRPGFFDVGAWSRNCEDVIATWSEHCQQAALAKALAQGFRKEHPKTFRCAVESTQDGRVRVIMSPQLAERLLPQLTAALQAGDDSNLDDATLSDALGLD